MKMLLNKLFLLSIIILLGNLDLSYLLCDNESNVLPESKENNTDYSNVGIGCMLFLGVIIFTYYLNNNGHDQTPIIQKLLSLFLDQNEKIVDLKHNVKDMLQYIKELESENFQLNNKLYRFQDGIQDIAVHHGKYDLSLRNFIYQNPDLFKD